MTSSTFTVQLTDSEFVPVSTSASYTISIAAGSNSNSLISGSYSFLFNGFDSQGSVALVGSVVADGNGKITGGGLDCNRVSGAVIGQSLTGTYSLGTDGRGTMEIIATNSLNVTLTTDYNLVLDSSGNIRFFENNSSDADNDTLQTHGAGIMKPANSASFGASAFNGNYAFLFRGFDLAGSPTVLGGVIHADGIGSITPGTGDYNEAGAFSPALGISGDFSFDSGSRGDASFTFDLPGKSPYTLTYVFRFVTPDDIFFVAVDPTDATHPRLSGEMILQSPTTTFNASSALSGPGVATSTGLNGANASVLAGLLTPVASTTPGCAAQVANCVTLAYDENNGGAIASPSFTGNFQISANGRVAFTNLGPLGVTQRIAVAYLTGPSQGFTIGSDAAVSSGLLDQQETGVAFADSSVQGGYTISAAFPAETAVNNVIGQVNASGTGSLVGVQTLDEFTPPLTPNLGQSLVASYANITAAGRGTLTTNSPIGFPTNLAFYIVSAGILRAIPLDASDQHPEVILFDH